MTEHSSEASITPLAQDVLALNKHIIVVHYQAGSQAGSNRSTDRLKETEVATFLDLKAGNFGSKHVSQQLNFTHLV